MNGDCVSIERYMRKFFKKKKDKEDQKILDQMLLELKEKHETEKKEKIKELQKQLGKIGV